MSPDEFLQPAAEEALVHAGIGASEAEEDATPEPAKTTSSAQDPPQSRLDRLIPRKGYRQIPILVSVLAVGLAGFSTIESIHRSDQENEATTRQQLTALEVQETNLQEQVVSTLASATLKAPQRAAGTVILIQAEQITANSAAQLAVHLASATSNDYLSLAHDYTRLGDLDDALAMTTRGLKISKNPTDTGNLDAEFGALYYQAGNPSKGVTNYRAAIAAFYQAKSFAPLFAVTASLNTRILWAEAAAQAGYCGFAISEGNTVRRLALTGMPEANATAILKSSYTPLLTTVNACVPRTKLSVSAILARSKKSKH